MAKSNRSAAPGKPKQSAPITSHKLFPPLVALWFSALLGIGSMILPPALLNSLADVTGIGKLLPSAAPPLGQTARLAITLVMACGGALLGLTFARRVAMEQGADAPRRREFGMQAAPAPADRLSEPRKPLSIHEELGDEERVVPSHDDSDDGAPRRRALALAEQEGPSDWFRPSLPFSDLADEPFAFEAPQAASPSEATLDLAGFASPRPFAREEDVNRPDQLADRPEDAFADAPLDEEWLAPAAEGPDQPEEPADIGLPIEERALSGLALGELAQRLNHALRLRAERMEREEPLLAGHALACGLGGPIADDGGVASFFETAAGPAEQAGSADEIWRDAPVVTPEQREQNPMLSVPAALRPVCLAEDEDSEETGPAALVRSHLQASTPEPEPIRQVFGSPVAFAQASEVEDEAEDEDDAEQGDFSSLLNLANPFRHAAEFVRIEEPEPEGDSVEPAVVFPGQEERRTLCAEASAQSETVLPFTVARNRGFARKSGLSAPDGQVEAAEPVAPGAPPVSLLGAAPAPALDPAETERALRLALATLQRMSGSA